MPRRHSIPLVGVGVALWTGLLGLAVLVCVVLIGWITAAHHSDALSPALAAAVAAWLLAQHCALTVPGGEISIVPLGLTWLLGALLVRGGRQGARLTGGRRPGDAASLAVAVAIPYAVAAALLTRAVTDAGVRATPLHAAPGAFVLSFLCVGYGALRESGAVVPVLDRLTPATGPTRLVLRTAAAGLVVVLGMTAAGTTLALVGHSTRAASLNDSLHPGWPGTALLALVSVAYLPNAILWAASFGAGPGFAVGAHTSVALSGVHLGAVPDLPLFAPLPQSGHPPVVAWLFVAAVLVAGGVIGRLIAGPRPLVDADDWWRRYRLPDAGRAVATGAVVGLLLGGLSWLSAGALGPGRMARVGPDGIMVALAVAAEVGLVAAATVVALAWRAHWSLGTARSLHMTSLFSEPAPTGFDLVPATAQARGTTDGTTRDATEPAEDPPAS